MNAPEYSLPLDNAIALKDARRWLLLGVVALGVAGLFAGVLANTNSPFFYKALVVHVDLSVLVWFLAVACMFFTLAGKGRGFRVVADASFYCFAAGTILIAASAFTAGEAYMSNYIPVIHHPLFFLGLSLLLCGVLGSIGNMGQLPAGNIQLFGVHSAAWIMLIAIVCFIWSQHTLPTTMTGQIYYEYAFWGGGHVLQFVHTQLMLVCWLWLASATGINTSMGHTVGKALYAIGLLSALAGLGVYFVHDAASDAHRSVFTEIMKRINGIAPLLLGAHILLLSFTSAKAETRLAKVTLLASIILFTAGGALGYMIAGSNVTVPAHYHGSIVGITLAFMGVAYLLLPHFGYRDVSQSKLALWQPIIYGGGQLCWMAGMAILGAHGVPRKTPGSADTIGALASFLKHGGDGLALIGGLLFVFVVLRAVYKKH